ncbi:MAG: methyltransferase domain-containing protein [Candidatus Moranbacteria bacterium]|nr:methyltransferase domain-containing protein [Candidatus Moranbacteria bacterium]
MSQVDVGNLLSTTKSYICSLERGNRNPSLKTLKKIALIFNVPVEILLRGNDIADSKYQKIRDDKFQQFEKKIKNWNITSQKKWCNFFIDEESMFFNKNRINQIKTIVKRYADNKNLSVIDSSCGTGRLTELLAKDGFKKIYGIDANPYVVEIAREQAIQKALMINYDISIPPSFEKKVFDVVFNIGTSIGYLQSEEDNFENIRRISCLVSRGGKIIIEAVNPIGILRNFSSSETLKLDGKKRSYQRFFDVRSSTSIENVIDTYDNKKQIEYFSSIRLFFPHELISIFLNSGFILVDLLDNNLTRKNTVNSPRLWYIFQKKNV